MDILFHLFVFSNFWVSTIHDIVSWAALKRTVRLGIYLLLIMCICVCNGHLTCPAFVWKVSCALPQKSTLLVCKILFRADRWRQHRGKWWRIFNFLDLDALNTIYNSTASVSVFYHPNTNRMLILFSLNSFLHPANPLVLYWVTQMYLSWMPKSVEQHRLIGDVSFEI